MNKTIVNTYFLPVAESNLHRLIRNTFRETFYDSTLLQEKKNKLLKLFSSKMGVSWASMNVTLKGQSLRDTVQFYEVITSELHRK